MRTTCPLLLTLVLLLAAPAATQAATTPPELKGFDAYAEQALAAWNVPGMAIAVVKDDKVVYARGFGVRTLGKKDKVDEKTIFAIGSATKAFTATLIGMLVDDGKLGWDDRVTRHLPGFELWDAYVSQQMTVRDLLSHRSGLERGDLIWYGAKLSRSEIIARLRHLEPSWSFRAQFGYQNLMFMVAGEVAALVAGKSWDALVAERILKPLGMSATSTTTTGLAKQKNVATPHAKVEDKLVTVPWKNIDNAAPAGSINSNVLEMASWVRFQLASGMWKGKQLIASGTLHETHTPQTVIRLEGIWKLIYPESHLSAYGLGWFLADYHGKLLVEHGGNIDGMSAMVAMIPEANVGVVVLANLDGTVLPQALAYRVLDAYLGAPERDWAGDIKKGIDALELEGKAAEKRQEDARKQGTKPSLSLDKYAGSYSEPFYGESTVKLEGGTLVWRYGEFVADLEHWQYDTYRAVFRDKRYGKALITFSLSAAGEVATASTQIVGDAEWKRTPDKPAAAVVLSDKEMARYAGRYVLDSPPLDMTVDVVGGSLKATLPGQPSYTLLPLSKTRFRVDVAEVEAYVEFEVKGDKAEAATIEQGGARFRMVRK